MPETSAIDNDIDDYERWLRRHCKVVEEDLDAKHERMRKSPFDFLRASYFRWARTIEAICPQLADAPKTLCVGDIHVENFGTWRDARRAWSGASTTSTKRPRCLASGTWFGLATSARLAPDLRSLRTRRRKRCWTAIEGPATATPAPGGRTRSLAAPARSRRTRRFAQVLEGGRRCAEASPPARVRKALERQFPRAHGPDARRSTGGGSLGRPRLSRPPQWQGGRIVHEAKARRAFGLALGTLALVAAIRSSISHSALSCVRPQPDHPNGYALRRMAPDAHKVELADVAGKASAASCSPAWVQTSLPSTPRRSVAASASSTTSSHREPAGCARHRTSPSAPCRRDFDSLAPLLDRSDR